MLLIAGLVGLGAGCTSTPGMTGGSARPVSHLVEIDQHCRLAHVGGDTRLIATDDGRLLLIGVGIGIMQSIDGGMTFSSINSPPGIRWPAIASDGSRVWVSWIERGSTDRAVVAAVGSGLGAPVLAIASSKTLIDTELVALGDGRLLLFVSEVEGRPNTNEATYTIQCLVSENGGLDWVILSRAVTGPFGVNVEDPRACITPGGSVLLAYEWETEEGGASKILVQRSEDGGSSWSPAVILWGGDPPGDNEPGGFVQVGSDLWFVASTDSEEPGMSYSGAEIAMIRSSDGGMTWTKPRTLISQPDEISMGGVVLDGVVILPSIRRYASAGNRYLALHRVDRIGRWPIPCGLPGMFSAGFETGEVGPWDQGI
jgi:hypothetical protein